MSVNSIAELKAITGSTANNFYNVLGYYNPGDGGGGDFYWDGTSTEKGNDGTIITPSSNPTSGRWKRLISDYITPEMFGTGNPNPLNNNPDDTSAFQAAIDFLAQYELSIFQSKKCGQIRCAPKEYFINSLIIKSNIQIVGIGYYSTQIIPIGKIKTQYIFDVTGTNHNSRIANFELSNIYISPSDSFIGSGTPYEINGINLSYCDSCRLNNVSFSLIDGICINQVENYDSNFDNISIRSCTTAATFYSGTADLTNAIHIKGCRFENTQILIGDGVNQQREINFTNCKFENSPIIHNGTSSVSYAACHFTPNTGQWAVTFNSTTSIDTRNTTFAGCTFVSSGYVGNAIQNVNSTGISLSGCTFSALNRLFTGPNFSIVGCQFYDNKESDGNNIINCTQSIISNNIFSVTQTGTSNYLMNLDKSIFTNNLIENSVGGILTIQSNCQVNTNIFLNNNYGTRAALYCFGSNNKLLNNDGLTIEYMDYTVNYFVDNSTLGVPNLALSYEGCLNFNYNSKQLFINDGSQQQRIPLNSPNQLNSTATDVPTLQADFNTLLSKLRNAGILV